MKKKTTKKVWKAVAGCPGYRISNYGELQSCYRSGNGGPNYDWREAKPLAGHTNPYIGHRSYGKQLHRPIPLLVKETFGHAPYRKNETIFKRRDVIPSRGTALTEKDVRDIANLITSKMSGKEIAEKYNVTAMQISSIKNGHQWASVTKFKKVPRGKPRPPISDNVRAQMKAMHKDGLKPYAIAKQLDFSHSTVKRIVTSK